MLIFRPCSFFRPGHALRARSLTAPWGSYEVLNSVSGTGPSDVWVVGETMAYEFGSPENAVILHWDGVSWSDLSPMFPANSLFSVWADAPDDAWAVGYSLILHWDGSAWSQVANPKGYRLNSVWASDANHVWATGGNGLVLFWNGAAWTEVASAMSEGQFPSPPWGFHANDVWVATGDGVVRYWP